MQQRQRQRQRQRRKSNKYALTPNAVKLGTPQPTPRTIARKTLGRDATTYAQQMEQENRKFNRTEPGYSKYCTNPKKLRRAARQRLLAS